MKALIKCIIAGAVILVVGIAIVVGTLAFNGWKIKKPEIEMQTFTATEDNTALEVEIGAGSVITEFYDGDKIYIEYPSSSALTSVINERNGVFRYESKIKSFWHWGSWDIPDTVIKLPKDTSFNYNLDLEVHAGAVNVAAGNYEKIVIEIHAGTITVNQSQCTQFDCEVSAGVLAINSLECNKFECDVSAGKLDIKQLDCPDIEVDMSAGNVSIDVNGAKADYSIRTHVSAGSCNVGNQTGSTDKKISVECSAGSVKINFAS